MARVRVLVVDDHVPLRIRQILTPAGKPFAGAAALQARPLAVDEGEVVVLLEERPVRGELRADGRPLVLLERLPFSAWVLRPHLIHVHSPSVRVRS